MKKFIIASASALAVLGLAACSDTDDTTTQSVEPEMQEQVVPNEPSATPPPATEEMDEAPAQDLQPAQ